MKTNLKIKRLPLSFSHIAIFILMLLSPQATEAEERKRLSIAAVVNDQIITASDLQKRLKVISVISPSQISKIQKRQLQKEVLNQLINEELQNQEVIRLKIKVSEKEINNAKHLMEQRFKLPRNTLNQFIIKNKLDYNDVISQIKTSLGWTLAVQRKFSNYLTISDEEVTEVVNRLRDNIGKERYLISEIFLPIDYANNENEVRSRANKLYNSLINGADFRKVARDYSATASAMDSGRTGWFLTGQLSPKLDLALQKIKIGGITTPVRTNSGFHILKLEKKTVFKEFDEMKVKVNLIETRITISKPDNNNNSQKKLNRLANSLSKIKSCGELEKLAQINTAYTTTNLGNFLVGELSEKLREIVLQSKIGIPNNPTKQDREISTITVCNRTTPPSNIPDDETVLRNLQGKKIESMARKYLRNLRQSAFVEKRL
jgi:peptidyl-prolyl cis-trans isomerase SurA